MTSVAGSALEVAVERLASASLDEVRAAADLQVRVDRKYLVGPEALDRLVAALDGPLTVLDIAGRRVFEYESVYFDTPDLVSYLDTAHRRRHRFKVRTRTYLDSRLCLFEIKVRDGRGRTTKRRLPYAADDRQRMTPAAREFAARQLERLDVPTRLTPVLTTRYRRATLVDLADGARMTVDADLRWMGPDGTTLAIDEELVVETKSAGPPTRADRQLWSLGIRPVSISKFGIGMAALDPSLPANRWHRLLRRHVVPPSVAPDRWAPLAVTT